MLEDHRLRHNAVTITSDPSVRVIPVYTFLIAVCDAWTALPDELKGTLLWLLWVWVLMVVVVAVMLL